MSKKPGEQISSVAERKQQTRRIPGGAFDTTATHLKGNSRGQRQKAQGSRVPTASENEQSEKGKC